MVNSKIRIASILVLLLGTLGGMSPLAYGQSRAVRLPRVHQPSVPQTSSGQPGTTAVQPVHQQVVPVQQAPARVRDASAVVSQSILVRQGLQHTEPPSAATESVIPSVPNWLANEPQRPANSNIDGQEMLGKYAHRANLSAGPLPSIEVPPAPPAGGYHAWWDNSVKQSFAANQSTVQVNIGHLITGALIHSSKIQVLAADPNIQRTALIEECAEFDWTTYLEGTYNNLNDPVGNVLTTGNNEDRFKDRTWLGRGGVRQRNRFGGEVDIAQQLGSQRNNSRFLLPNPQATTRLELQYTQPLLNGAGRAVNDSRVVLANIQVDSSVDTMHAELQDHLFEVTESYWELYRARAIYLQRAKLLRAAEGISQTLEARQAVDAMYRQVLRARAAVATRRSEIIRAGTSIRNAESRLRLLVNDPALVNCSPAGMIPVDSPLGQVIPLSMQYSLQTALTNRQDISKAIRDVRAAAVQIGVAKNDVLPKLDLVASTYVAGLARGTRVGNSLGDQFSEGRPGYTVGLQFELPIGNRAALARRDRRHLELARAFSTFRLTVEEGLTAVEMATREVDTAYREMASRFHAMAAAEEEAEYLLDRWQVLPGAEDSAVLLLENLLDAQERVADEETRAVNAQINYAIAIVKLKKQMGTLLSIESCNFPPVPTANAPVAGPRVAAQPVAVPR